MQKLTALLLIGLFSMPSITLAAKPVKVDLQAIIEQEIIDRENADAGLQSQIDTHQILLNDINSSYQFGNVLVYDVNDDFIGYMVSSDTDGSSFSLISPQKYFAIFHGEHWAYQEGYADPSGLTNMCFGNVYYDNPTCSGTYYVSLHPDNLFHRTRPGIVCGGTTAPI